MRVILVGAVLFVAFVGSTVPALAQDRLWAVEATAGWAGFVDDSLVIAAQIRDDGVPP